MYHVHVHILTVLLMVVVSLSGCKDSKPSKAEPNTVTRTQFCKARAAAHCDKLRACTSGADTAGCEPMIEKACLVEAETEAGDFRLESLLTMCRNSIDRLDCKQFAKGADSIEGCSY